MKTITEIVIQLVRCTVAHIQNAMEERKTRDTNYRAIQVLAGREQKTLERPAAFLVCKFQPNSGSYTKRMDDFDQDEK